MMETFSIVSLMACVLSWFCTYCEFVGRRPRQMQPRGFGIPAILAAVFAGPLGNSS